MSHEITVTNGTAFYAGELSAWHQLGTVVGRPMAAQEALEFANLAGWNVRKVPVWADVSHDEAAKGNYVSGRSQTRGLLFDNQYATVFDNPVTKLVEPIAIVGEQYTPIQSEKAAEFGQAIIDEVGPNVVSLGSLRGHAQIFMVIKLPQTMVLENDNGRDVTEFYLTIFNSFDGSSKMFAIITSIRVVCANTARAAIAGAPSKFGVAHTSGWQGNVAKAREVLGLSFKYEEAFEAKVREELFGVPMSLDEMTGFAADLTKLTDAKTEQTKTQRQNVTNGIVKLFVESPTIKGTPIAGTRFAAYNAVTEYVDHHSVGLRGSKDADEGTVKTLRATRTVTNLASDTDTTFKTAAWKLLTV
jgi:phage/plasmid-like protein (TIGR03299 family)